MKDYWNIKFEIPHMNISDSIDFELETEDLELVKLFASDEICVLYECTPKQITFLDITEDEL